MVHRYTTLFLLFFCVCCREKKTTSSDKSYTTFESFTTLFKEINPPVRYSDTSLSTTGDTTHIDFDVFTRFVPAITFAEAVKDSSKNIFIQPVTKIKTSEATYLITKITHQKKTDLIVFMFDAQSNYIAYLSILKNHYNDKHSHSVLVTEEPTFITSREKKGKEDKLFYTRDSYAYDYNTKSFITVMKDSNEDANGADEIINPIDTLPLLNKYSADYKNNDKNFVSVRDGKNNLTYIFFIHFEKNGGDCLGELKGSMTLVSANKAVYRESGDPCGLEFTFTKSSIILTETNCGNHRGMKCLFNGSYKKSSKLKNSKLH